MRYKILFISSWFPNKLEPTNGNFVQRHAEAAFLRNDVEILHAIGDPDQKKSFVFEEQIINGIRTLIVYYRKTSNPALNFYRRMRSYKKGFRRMQKPDLVHANILRNSMLFAVYLKRKFKIPFVVSEHWSGFLKINEHQLSKLGLRITREIARHASYILPVSNYLLTDLRKLGLQTNFQVIENVVNTELFHVKRHSADEFKFLHISNLISIKNPEKIIDVAVKLRSEFDNFELHIGGDGDIEILNKIILNHKAGDYIKTFPTLKSEEVAYKMRSSNCFILFSDYENFPCVLLETLSAGTPAIATKVGGIPEIINERNGILISKCEIELYNAMKDVLLEQIDFDEPHTLHEFVNHHFSMETISRKFDEIYQKVLR
ncbi:glycosyltransferase [Kaistella polysaccharea]|uniref:glycosyltransferase n=1 Tax=Kaistella polysaccharea TaxID=2878534 RepID=UPI001CF183D0|nr:glycosyltransferase [Kaistella polysaccharea]